MGLFGKLKDKIGIGTLRAEIQLTQPGFEPGEPITGQVVLHSAASDTQVTSVLLQLVNYGTDVAVTEVVTEDYWRGTSWDAHEKKFKFNEVVYEQYMAQGFVLATGQRLELGFDIGTTPEVVPSTKYNGYMLKVHVDVPGQIDTRAAKPVHIMISGAPPPQLGMDGPGPAPDDVPQPGEYILAYWEEDECWYECTANMVDQHGVHVAWQDGSTSHVPFDSIHPYNSTGATPQDLAPGMRVLAKYGDGWYEATVGGASGAQVSISWDDGTQSWVSLVDVRLL